MARVIIFGSLNWDTPIRLTAPIASGGRLFGTSLEGQMAGRLGGGGGNTGCGLAMAGHHVAVVSPVPLGPIGDRVLAEAEARDIDTRFVTRPDVPFPTTLLLIEPNGERVVIGLDLPPAVLKEPPVPARIVDADTLRAFRPDALYLRRVDDLGTACLGCGERLSVAEWPGHSAMDRLSKPLSVHVLVVSRDDLTLPLTDDVWPAAQSLTGGSLQALVVTDGPGGAHLFTQDGRQTIATRKVEAVDCTGAGDAFAAGLIRARLEGASWPAAVAHGNDWGALTVTDHASVPPAAAGDLGIPV